MVWPRAHENYPDSTNPPRVGLYTALVEDLHEPYVRPQENGARGGIRCLALTDILGAGFMVIGEQVDGDGFSFTAHDYTGPGFGPGPSTPMSWKARI